jgi:hypothetical protein
MALEGRRHNPNENLHVILRIFLKLFQQPPGIEKGGTIRR